MAVHPLNNVDKNCIICDKVFFARDYDGVERKYCSRDCAREQAHKSNTGRVHKAESRALMAVSKIGDANPAKRPEVREKMREAAKTRDPFNYSGERSHRWKGGVTPERTKIWRSKEYREWRLAVFTRDDYTCVLCGERGGNGHAVRLNADHIKPFAHFPDLRFSVDNGRTLCVPCHQKTDTYGGRAIHYKTPWLSK